MAKSIPDRWLEYKPCGDVMEGVPIIAFRVPLKNSAVQNLEPEQQFTIKSLLKEKPNIKFVIDLTNTARYYKPIDFISLGVNHAKIMIPGRQIPPPHCIKQFYNVMDKFMKSRRNDQLIGVHCTHGVNRTGYLVCRYLIEELGWSCDKAMSVFAEARGHAVEREVFVDDLKRMKSGNNCHRKNSHDSYLAPSTSRLPRRPRHDSRPLHYSRPPMPAPPRIPDLAHQRPYQGPPPNLRFIRPNNFQSRPPYHSRPPRNDYHFSNYSNSVHRPHHQGAPPSDKFQRPRFNHSNFNHYNNHYSNQYY